MGGMAQFFKATFQSVHTGLATTTMFLCYALESAAARLSILPVIVLYKGRYS